MTTILPIIVREKDKIEQAIEMFSKAVDSDFLIADSDLTDQYDSTCTFKIKDSEHTIDVVFDDESWTLEFHFFESASRTSKVMGFEQFFYSVPPDLQKYLTFHMDLFSGRNDAELC
jgi:hypothetical protein